LIMWWARNLTQCFCRATLAKIWSHVPISGHRPRLAPRASASIAHNRAALSGERKSGRTNAQPDRTISISMSRSSALQLPTHRLPFRSIGTQDTARPATIAPRALIASAL
jgi:hypothetical protein